MPHSVAVRRVLLVLAYPVLLHGLDLTAELQGFVSTLENYAQQKNDIVFVLDESGSIGEENFPAELTFTELMARLLVVSENFSRLTVVTFSDDNLKHIDQIADGGNMCGFVQQVNQIPYRTGGTRTKEALQYASRLLDNGRTDANRIIVLISDGQANSGSEPNYVARTLKSQGIIIFAVGVAGINKDELEAVATSQKHIYMLRDFAYIKQVNNDLRTDIRESQWDAVAVQECLRESAQCDSNAICACGAQGGTHRCVCKQGYQGDGTLGNCQRCGRGTYKERTGSHNCKPCPPNSTTSGEGSTTEAQCSCIPGYEGDPGSRVPCTPIKCAPLSDPTGGSTIPRKCGSSFGDQCDFLCKEGHCPYQCERAMLAAGDLPWNRVTKVPRVCQADKTWSGPEFFCEKVRCPALLPPANGALNCSSTTLEFGTTCTPGCNLGYNIAGGDPYLTCSVHGSWNGQMPTCKTVECQALKVNEKLHVSPGNCKKRPSAYDFLCQYHCKEGWTLVDRDTKKPVDGVRKCLADGTWLNAEQKITCQDAQKPMIVNCPQDMTIYNAPRSAFSDPVQWKEPVSTDNSGSSTVKLVFPLEITTLPYQFPIGEHDIRYVATDAEGLASDPCAFKVFVLDVEDPVVTFCPDDILKVSGTRETNVTWEEPQFLDYGPGELKVVTDREPGSAFSWGPPSTVTYHATDASENTATCSFQVIVKPYQCPYVPPPKNGFVTCDSETERQFCSVYCDQGYEFVFKPEPLYRCKQTKQGGHWTTFSRTSKLKSSWPDCAVSSRSKKTDFTVDFKFATNSCQISEQRKAELKKKFFEKLSKKLARFPGMCEASQGCTVDNVDIACDAKKPLDNVPRVQRRDTGVARSQPEFDLIISFRIPFAGDFNATHLVETCEQCKNASVFHPSTAEEAALTEILEEASTEAVNSTVAEVLPEAVLVEAKHSIKSVCERGQVSNGLFCVNCPVGTFYENETSCTSCPIGTYSAREAADSCVPCPANKTTLTQRASSESECRALCKPGTWSTTGKEPCIACGTDAYQDQKGQSSCKKCSAGLSTGQWGADSSKSCRDICDAGTYSKNGLEPCTACPIGHYQPGRNQTACIACDVGLNTRTTGAISKSDCVAPDHCERLQPCANGSTCVDEPSGYRCLCPAGLSGRRCEVDADDCAPGLCQNGGTCLDGRDSFSCRCLPGYVGSSCEIDEDDCASAPCLNGATCVDGVNEFTCHCAKGFTGKRCEAVFHDCAMMPCRNGGSCFESFAGFRCCCPKGFAGERCEVAQHACSPNPCANNATCLVTRDDSFQCACAPGYEGDLCERDVDECASQPCLNGGTCTDGRHSFTCHCTGLYEGATCAAVRSSQFSLHFANVSVLNFAQLPVNRALRALTLSFYMKTSQTKERGTVVSYAFVDPRTKRLEDNALTISDPNKLLLYVFGESYDTQAVANDGQWHHCAVTWDGADGRWLFYWDQRVTAQDTRAAGEYLFAGVLVLGQDQDDLGSDFNGIEAYSGHVAELNLWDYAMSPDEVKQLSLTCGLAGNVVSWPELRQVATSGLVTDDYAEPCKSTSSSMDVSCHSASSSFESRTRCSRKVPPCDTSPCQNDQQCIENNDGSSECRCNESYEGRYCQYDVDECLFGSHNCSHLCVNIPGSYECACPQGMLLGEDGVTCLDKSYCTDGLSTYLEGESWERGCQHCACSMGLATCSPVVCPAVTCGAGQVLFKEADQCCPSCVKEQPKCMLLKNSTLVTFDGLSFPLTRESEYIMLQDCHSGNFYGHVSFLNQKVAAHVSVHCLRATLFSNGSAAVDGQLVSLPHKGHFVLEEAHGGALELRTRQGLVVALYGNGAVVASLPHGFDGKTCGLCGNANGQVRDDLTTKHHVSAKTTEEFLASWRLPAKDRQGKKNKHAACSDLPHAVAKSAIQTCRMIRNNKNLQPCLTRLENPWVFFENCVDQMCSCRGKGYCYCDAFAAFKLACEQRNITFNQLPGKTCESPCPAGMEFRTCGPVNIPRCSPQNKNLARDSCMPGCFCPPYQVLHKGQCIQRESCPATPWRNFQRTYSANEIS